MQPDNNQQSQEPIAGTDAQINPVNQPNEVPSPEAPLGVAPAQDNQTFQEPTPPVISETSVPQPIQPDQGFTPGVNFLSPQPTDVPQPPQPSSPALSQSVVPEEVKGLNFGAFFLTWVWGIGNSVWISLLAFIPFIGFFVPFVLLFKGNEMAWKAKQWSSVEEFKKTQRMWTYIGLVVFVLSLVIAIGFIALGASSVPKK